MPRIGRKKRRPPRISSKPAGIRSHQPDGWRKKRTVAASEVGRRSMRFARRRSLSTVSFENELIWALRKPCFCACANFVKFSSFRFHLGQPLGGEVVYLGADRLLR